jgi:iron complex outermembrane receptor protein
MTIKLRAAYGKGIRWPETTARGTLWEGVRADRARLTLDPEEQAGWEGGFDLSFGNAWLVSVTRFDQTASGLIQRVAIPGDSAPGGPGPRRLTYTLQNVGEIANDGWEIQGTLTARGFWLSGAVSFVDSRVQRLANGYSGDLAVGDRMLEVPARTMSATAGWRGAAWSASVTAYRAEDWINYDRLALTRAFVTDTGRSPRDFVGPELRRFWREYPGVTHLRASATRAIRRGLTVVLAGDNLLNRQSGEPDNITVLPGRTVSIGLRGEF